MNSRIQAHAYVITFYLWSHQDSYFLPDTGCLHCSHSPEILCLIIDGTYIFGFYHMDFIHHVVNNSVVLLSFLVPFLMYGIAPAVLCRLARSVLSSKFAQKLTFIRRMSEDMDHTVFTCALRAIYILFMALTSSLILFG